MILAIDPGNIESAFIVCNMGVPQYFGKLSNRLLRNKIYSNEFKDMTVIVEKIVSYGMAVGQEVFDTARWSGRFEEALTINTGHCYMMNRRDVKLSICNNSKANDSNIRTALIDLYGPGKHIAVGRKSAPGPLFGITYDVWQALALVVTFERQSEITKHEDSC